MRAEELKRRIDRLLSGGRNTRDLDILFLWLRERSFGNRVVADVGDFVAHSEERKKGIAWRGAQWFWDMADWVLPRTSPEVRAETIDIGRFKAAVLGALELSEPAKIRKDHGLAKDKARAVLASALKKVVGASGSKLQTSSPLSPKEHELVMRLSSVLVAQPTFTDSVLVDQLTVCLTKNGLVAPKWRPPDTFRNLVALYAIEKMHMARILLKDGRVVMLAAAPLLNQGEEYLSIYSHGTIRTSDPPEPVIGYPLYPTSLRVRDWCESDLLFTRTTWDFALEIGSNGKLQKL